MPSRYFAPRIETVMKLANKFFTIGVIISVVGLAGVVPSAYFWYSNRQVTQAASNNHVPTVTKPTVVEASKTITGKPVRLLVPSLGMDLSVVDGMYDTNTGQWTLSLDKVHYALMTVQPNDKQGNTLIYGHYRPEVFAYLHTIQKGALVKIKTENNHTFTYKFTGSKVVNPTDTSVLSYEGKPMLTLQTCTGAFMQNRQLFSFDLVDVK